MALYAIGDLHLSFGTDKPMDVFGGVWNHYIDKIRDGFSALGPEDTCVICGDLTWGMTMEESLTDFRFLDRLPGTKIILKGNHDYWWSTASKARKFFSANGITTLNILNNNSYTVGSAAVCGTRGWFYEEESGAEHDKKIMAREVLRLETSLKAAGNAQEKICFLHYPPIFRNFICRDIIDLMKDYGVRDCWYGHIHGIGHRLATVGEVDGITYHMVAADFINFAPVRVK